MKNRELDQIMRFTAPVALENLLAQVIAMLVPAFVGGISGSALAGGGLVNTAITMYTAVFSLMTVGGAVLLARSIGANDREAAAHVTEQSILLATIVSIVMMVASLIAAEPIMRILMPAAEDQMFYEGVVYFRYMMISFPALIIHSVVTALLRAAGNSRGPMLATTVLNVIQVVAAAVLIRELGAGIAGAGLSYVVARGIGMVMVLVMILRYHGNFRIRVARLFKPHLPTWWRMIRVGTPNTLESLMVQAGYLTANSMIVGLGTHQATVYQVTNTLYGFAAYPQGICGPILISFVGQALGAGMVDKAKKTLWGIYSVGMVASLVISLAVALLVDPLSRFYTSDPLVLEECRTTIWFMFVLCIPAMSINAMDPGLRTGGDSKWIMAYTVFAVWCIRIPLTWLFCYHFNGGVVGLFVANTISLIFRALCSQFRFHTGRWLHSEV